MKGGHVTPSRRANTKIHEPPLQPNAIHPLSNIFVMFFRRQQRQSESTQQTLRRPFPDLLAVAHLQPDRVLLLHSDDIVESKGPARRLQFQPGGDLLLATYEDDATKTWLVL